MGIDPLRIDLRFAPNFDETAKQAARQAANAYSNYFNDDININISFVNSDNLPSDIRSATFNNEIGGTDSNYVIDHKLFVQHLTDDAKASGDDVSLSAAYSAHDQLYLNTQNVVDYEGYAQDRFYDDRIRRYGLGSFEEVRLTNANAKALGIVRDANFKTIDYGTTDAVIVINNDYLDSNPGIEALKSLYMHEIGHALGLTSATENISVDFAKKVILEPFVHEWPPSWQWYVVDDYFSDDDWELVNEQKQNITPFDYFRYVSNTNGTADTSDDTVNRSLFPAKDLNSSVYFSYDGGKTNHGDLEEGEILSAAIQEIQEEGLLNLDGFEISVTDSFQGAHFAEEEHSIFSPLNSEDFNHGNYFTEQELDIFNAIGWDINYQGTTGGHSQWMTEIWHDTSIDAATKAIYDNRNRRKNNTTSSSRGVENGLVTDEEFNIDSLVAEIELYKPGVATVAEIIRLEAEDPERFFDTTQDNLGQKYRSDALDVRKVYGINGAHAVGWTAKNEYLEFDVDIKVAGNYDVLLRVASPTFRNTKTLDVTLGEKTKTTQFTTTGGWNKFQDLMLQNFELGVGETELRLDVITGGGFDIDYLEIIPASET